MDEHEDHNNNNDDLVVVETVVLAINNDDYNAIINNSTMLSHITGNKAEEKSNLEVNDLNSYILANAVI